MVAVRPLVPEMERIVPRRDGNGLQIAVLQVKVSAEIVVARGQANRGTHDAYPPSADEGSIARNAHLHKRFRGFLRNFPAISGGFSPDARILHFRPQCSC